MKNTLKKIIGAVLVAALLVGGLTVPSQRAQAARVTYLPRVTTGVVIGKKVSFSHDEKGKATWKLIKGKKNVKIVKKSGNSITIKGVKKGTVKLQLVIGKNKETCNIDVLPKVLTLTYNGKNASEIKKKASMADNAGAKTKIVVKNGVKNIKKNDFSGIDMIAVDIPDSVISIGDFAFNSCRKIKTVKIPDSVTTIGKGAFRNCILLKSITIPSGVTEIKEQTFSVCNSLEDITLPNGLKSIGSHAFVRCTSLRSINIPDSTTKITANAFSGCSILKKITWKGVTYTSVSDFYSAFNANIQTPIPTTSPSGSTPVPTVPVSTSSPSGNTSVPMPTPSGNVQATTTPTLIPSPSGDASVTPVPTPTENPSGGTPTPAESPDITPGLRTIEYDGWDRGEIRDVNEEGEPFAVVVMDGVESIEDYEFEDCSNLVSVTIPDSVISIGGYAFSGCNSLTDITIPNSVTSIMGGAFANCSSLVTIKVSEGNEIYDSRENCNAIIDTATNTLIAGCSSTIIPESVTGIGVSAFEGCSGMTSIIIPNSVTSIEMAAFYLCSNLTNIEIPDSVISIDYGAFCGCSSLTDITIPDSVTRIWDETFSDCSSLTSITIPDSVTNIGVEAFSGCSSLESVTIPDSVTSIGVEVFGGCNSLTGITWKGATYTSVNAFENAFGGFYYN